MKRFVVFGGVFCLLIALVAGWESVRLAGAAIKDLVNDDPDIPSRLQTGLTKEEFMMLRAEGISLKRGIEKDKPFDPTIRAKGIRQLERQEAQRLELPASRQKASSLQTWTPIGPNPIPNAQVGSGAATTASGRVLSIAIHPTNPDLVYVGTAQGGLYRTADGGVTWTPLLDNALSLAVNTVTIAPSQPETIFVGTGESGFCGDCFFGAGIYRIDNASTTANLTGPIGAAIFNGRSVSKIVVHPIDPNIIFATSASGIGGIGGALSTNLSPRGIFRSTNALRETPSFTKMTVTGLGGQDRAFADMAMDPGNPDLVLASVADSFALGEGGVYRSTDAVSNTSPTFVRTFATQGTGTAASRTELALHRSESGDVTVYAASGSAGGTVHKSVDAGITWTHRIDNNFCTPQCFYDIAIAVSPADANTVYLGGSSALTFGRSLDGGGVFTGNGLNFTAGLHSDTHTIAVAPSDPSIVYFGSDGGIYRTDNVAATPIVWRSLNNATFIATQFMSLAVHPTDPNFTIGGTQDNGTMYHRSDGTWFRADGGDGGSTAIDQNATDLLNVRMYHTYFSDRDSMGYARALTPAAADSQLWTFHGCGFSSAIPNGMTCNATANLFYAPLETGPGNPNTLYFGSDVLYRSSDGGATMTKVSQEPLQTGFAISAIGIAPQNDDVRIVGQNNGNLFGTTSGSSILRNLDPAGVIPNSYIGRGAIDPQNVDKAYVTLAAFGVSTVWRTSDLSSPTPTWVTASTGLPQVPVSSFVIDPLNPEVLYAGTDIGVYVSNNGGELWAPFGTGLPRVAVFDMAIQPTSRMLRIATHGRGMWQIPLPAPTASISGRVMTPDGRGLRNVSFVLTDPFGNSTIAQTSSFGFFQVNGVVTGDTYVMAVRSKRYRFPSRRVDVSANMVDVDFTGQE
ncbi:MAG: hypothetical protein ABR530_04230 [Pyrinomonadaceae bacterium]